MKKLVSVGALMLVVLMGVICVGCGKTYNAVMYDNAGEYVNGVFLSEHSAGSFVIRSREKFEEIFLDFSEDVDFEKDMLLLHVFTTIYGRPCKIKSINVNKEKLQVNYEMVKPKAGIHDASAPSLRCLVVKMDKLDVTEVSFKQK